MIPTRIVLSGYLRFMTSDHDYVEMTFDNPLQIVLGTNGCGKSSLLSELTFFPSHHSNFAKGGYKIIEGVHNHLHYIARSDYNGGTGKHSLFCVEEQREYNPGGTYKAQVDLVESVFGWDRDLMELMLGQKRFTRMSTNERRKWLTRLCPVDLGTAFKLLNTCKSLHRDQKGVLNMVSKRLVETTKAAEQTTISDDIQVVIKEHHTALERLYQQRTELPPLPVEIETRRLELEDRCKEHLLNTPTIPSELGIRNQAALSQKILEARAHITMLESTGRSIIEQIDRIQRELAQFNDIDPSALQGLKEQERTYTQNIRTLEREYKAFTVTWPKMQYDHLTEQDIQSLFHDFNALLDTIPANPDGALNAQKARETQVLLKQKEQLYRQTSNELDSIRKRLQFIKECEDVNCPECKHTFKPNVSPREVEVLTERSKVAGKTLDALDVEIESLGAYVESYRDYHRYVVGYRELTQRFAWARSLWAFVTEHKIPFREPQVHVPDLIFWQQRELKGVQLAKLKRALTEFKEKIALISSLDTSAITRRKQEMVELEQSHAANIELIAKYRADIRRYETLEGQLNHYVATGHQLLSDYESLQQEALLVIQHLQNEVLGIDIRKHQSEVAILESQLQELNYRKGTLAALEDQKRQALEDQVVYGTLVEALNVQDGLIGQYLKASMGSIVERLNAIIDRIWTYPLHVLTCPLEKDELTYKFPLEIGEQKRITPDIELGSSSQRDIIDFAFTLIVRAALDRNDIPLFMDELGSSFDEAHRNALNDLIETMMENQMVQQAFFISHFETIYGAFTHADVCVLDATNIVKPARYNEHVRFKPVE